MDLSPSALKDLARTPTGRKALRYSAVSVVSIVVSLLTLHITLGMLRLASAAWCQVIAVAAGTVPAYTLNRYWAWGKRGRSDLLREVLPFWILAFVGLGFSVFAVHLADGLAHHLRLSHAGITFLDELASLTSYGLLWVGKFIIFNRLLFVDREKPDSNRRRPPPGEGTGGHPVVATGHPA